MSERVAFVGSRSWDDERSIGNRIADLNDDDIVITGGAPGADRVSEKLARERGLAVLVIRADWQKHGRRAGPIRNSRIVEHCHHVVAFWDGESPGTLDTIRKAEAAGKQVTIIKPWGRR
jgi:hypothetical protein